MLHAPAIHALTDDVINQIAAGEVVERPLSIVKELVENSLDAQASRIDIALDDGGIARILVRDNGHGIAAEEFTRALARHHTSKLESAADLSRLGSLGFRGEALASIAAVAEIILTSRTGSDDHGWTVHSHPGNPVSAPKPAPHPVGTSVEVRGLFAEIPARRRFLKRPRTEFLHCQQLVRRLAFCYPGVAIRFEHDGRSNLNFAPAAVENIDERRWRLLFGREFVQHAARIDYAVGDVVVNGWVGTADYSRQNSDIQFLAVNGRLIRDRQLAHAVRTAYENSLEEGRHVAYALHVTLDPDTVDVNVHPGKAEVRFADARTIHDIVYTSIKQVLDRGAFTNDETRSGFNPIAATDVTSTTVGVAEQAADFTANRKTASKLPATQLLAIVDNEFALVANNTRREDAVTLVELRRLVGELTAQRLRRGDTHARPLIIPETTRAQLADASLKAFEKFGVSLERLKEDTLVLRQVPRFLSAIDAGAFAAALCVPVEATEREAVIQRIAAAASQSLAAPSGVVPQRQWLEALWRQCEDMGLAIGDFCHDVSGADFRRLLDHKPNG